MSTNALVVQNIQMKIDAIVVDAPRLYKRLNVLMTSASIWKVLTQPEATMQKLTLLMLDDTSQIPPPVFNSIVSDETIPVKRALLDQLKGEVVLFFRRLELVLTWDVIFDLCANSARFVVPQAGDDGRIDMIEIFCSHIEEEYEARQMEQRRQELEESSSSDDSCNRLIW